MATYTVPAGDTAYTNTLTANTADTVNFADRFGFIAVTNVSASGVIWVTANGSVAVDSGAGVVNAEPVEPGQTIELANGLVYWGQASSVLVAGSVAIPRGGGAAYVATSSTVTTTAANPGHVHPYGSSLAGGGADNGTSVSLICTTANEYTITAAG
jgi:hypothetical protein